jgi:hypothetical protein
MKSVFKVNTRTWAQAKTFYTFMEPAPFIAVYA